MSELKNLFKPIEVSGVEIRNRVFISPHVVQYAHPDGTPRERNINYFVERAKNGVGLIIVEATYFLKDKGRDFSCQLGIYDDSMIPAWKKLVDAVHKEGAKLSLQIFHPGRQADTSKTAPPAEAPSAIPCPIMQQPTVEMTKERIKEVVKAFGQGARRAKEAGFDFVEIHAAHGYLVNEFLSPYSNKRTDEYGGSFENRIRFLQEIFTEIKNVCGEDYPVGIRISGDEFVEGGLTLEDQKELAKKLEEWGIAYISVSAGTYTPLGVFMMISPMEVPFAPLEHLAAGVKSVVNVPVFTANSVVDPVLADQIVGRGSADMVALTRAHIADPEILKKAREGRLEDIRNCVRCNHGCIDRLFVDLDITCTVNAQAGREKELEIKPAATKKKVVIVGGGPAGLEAARVAKLRGHDVVLYEKENELGGLNRYAQLPPKREEFGGVTRWQVMQVEKLGVEVKLGVEATVETVLGENPDVVIVATGSNLNVPAIDGIYNSDGTLKGNVVFLTDVLTEKVEVGDKVVVIGANDIGLEVADFIRSKGKDVTVVDCEKNPSQELLGGIWWMNFIPRLQEEGVKIICDKFVKRVTDTGVVLDRAGMFPPSLKEGPVGDMEEEVLEADTIVIGSGRKSNDSLFEELVGKVKEVYKIGDARKPRHTYRAVKEGFETGLAI